MARGSYQEMAAQKAARKKHNKAAAKVTAKAKATVPPKKSRSKTPGGYTQKNLYKQFIKMGHSKKEAKSMAGGSGG